MNIGIDFDEVIAHLLEPLLQIQHKKTGKIHKRDEFDSYDWWLTWNITKEEAINLIDDFHENYEIKSIEPIEHAVESIKSLLHNRDKLFVITSRPLRFKKKTEDWINHHIKTNKIEVINAGDFHKGQAATKSEICKKLKIEIMLEDAPSTALDCAENGVKVLLFDKPWNKKISHKNIVRVNGWEEAMKIIQKSIR